MEMFLTPLLPPNLPPGYLTMAILFEVNGRTDGQTMANSIVPLPHFVRRGTKRKSHLAHRILLPQTQRSSLFHCILTCLKPFPLHSVPFRSNISQLLSLILRLPEVVFGFVPRDMCQNVETSSDAFSCMGWASPFFIQNSFT